MEMIKSPLEEAVGTDAAEDTVQQYMQAPSHSDAHTVRWTMDGVHQFSKNLMKCESENTENLKKAFENLSFKNPGFYLMLFNEMKERELETNDPQKLIEKSTSTSNQYKKIHQGLILVKSDNISVLEEYQKIIKSMLIETVNNQTCIMEAMKICTLIENKPFLTTIANSCQDLIRQVKSRYSSSEFFGHITTDIERDESLDISSAPILLKPIVWKNLRNKYLNPLCDLSDYDWKCFNDKHLELVKEAHSNSTLANPNIVTQEMYGVFSKWLEIYHLSKYTWFFNKLSYLEIILIDEKNIEEVIAKVKKNNMIESDIKFGVQKNICYRIKALKHRSVKFDNILLKFKSRVSPLDLSNIIVYMQEILQYPLPNKYCVFGMDLQNTIVHIMELYYRVLMKELNSIGHLISNSLIGNSIKKFMECIALITGNHAFVEYHISKISIIRNGLMDKIRRMPKDFY